METIRLDNLALHLDMRALEKKLHVRTGSQDERDLMAMAKEAEALGRPRIVYGVGYIEDRSQENVRVEGIQFHSRVLSVNLEKAERIFPFVGTCGMELQEWSDGIDDMLWGFWAEGIKEEGLMTALDAFQQHLHDRYRPGHLSTMSPGSLENWPINQQTPLFSLLGNPQEVRLTDSMLMVPTKSVSGITFPTDASFESCQLCPRQNCPGRRAPYDESLYAQKYCPAA